MPKSKHVTKGTYFWEAI